MAADTAADMKGGVARPGIALEEAAPMKGTGQHAPMEAKETLIAPTVQEATPMKGTGGTGEGGRIQAPIIQAIPASSKG